MAGVGNLSIAEKEDLIGQVKQQIAMANAQELLTVEEHMSCLKITQSILSVLCFQKMTEKCFKKCVAKPGVQLDSSEQKCISMCMDRYMDSWNLVSRTYSNRLQREQNKM